MHGVTKRVVSDLDSGREEERQQADSLTLIGVRAA
jgi:hypothetical protein